MAEVIGGELGAGGWGRTWEARVVIHVTVPIPELHMVTGNTFDDTPRDGEGCIIEDFSM